MFSIFPFQFLMFANHKSGCLVEEWSAFSQSLDTSHCSIWSIRNEKLHLSAQLLCVCCLFSIANGVALLIDQFAVAGYRHSNSNTTISLFNRSFNEGSPNALQQSIKCQQSLRQRAHCIAAVLKREGVLWRISSNWNFIIRILCSFLTFS